MAYRRKNPNQRISTFVDDFRSPSDDNSSSSLAAQAIRASSAHRDSSLSSAYGESAYRDSNRQRFSPSQQDSTPYEYTSMRTLDESKYGFWSVLARKAKSILEDDNVTQKFETPDKTSPQTLETSTADQFHRTYRSHESYRKNDNPKLQKGIDAIASSLNYIGGTIGKSLEEGLTIVENRTADIISETRKLHMRKKGSHFDSQNQATESSVPQQPSQMQNDQETQLKASRDVRWQMCITGSNS